MTQARTFVLKPFKNRSDRPPRPSQPIFDKDGQPKRFYKKKEGFTRWRESEHIIFVKCVKKHGRNWAKCVEELGGSKNEQQCRTRGIVMLQKLREKNFDNELLEALTKKKKDNLRKPGRSATTSVQLDILDVRKEQQHQLTLIKKFSKDCKLIPDEYSDQFYR